MSTKKSKNEYKFRHLPCSIQPDEKLWCVSGQCAGFGGGVLEWCYDEEDALYILSLMKNDPRMSNLKAESFIDSMKARREN